MAVLPVYVKLSLSFAGSIIMAVPEDAKSVVSFTLTVVSPLVVAAVK